MVDLRRHQRGILAILTSSTASCSSGAETFRRISERRCHPTISFAHKSIG
jgi:hypothetical protein